ncbi:MarR family transcriptional regulator [Actinomadura sp. NPDC048394]|uniref:MarR family transcriptional regulator n=1 Tax=Actinomadura sp. NPDC048394 TaxID=3158223 RepID=UPI0033CF4664
MAAKNITTGTATGNGVIGAQGTVDNVAGTPGGERPAGAAGAVWDALTANPGATVGTIAAMAGVSRATVARTLTALEGDGRAVRTRGGRDGGKQQPDTWHATDATGPDDAAPANTEADAAPTGPAPDVSADGPEEAPSGGANGGGGTDAEEIDETAPGAATTDADGGEDAEAKLDPAAVAEARDALTALRDGVTAALAALEAGDGNAALVAAEGAYSGSGLVRRLVRAAAQGPVRTASGRVRSQPGAMRAKVAAHLDAHPGTAFTPHEVAKVIGHSAGAVSNALDRLAEAGHAELVCERPRRFTTTHRAAPGAANCAPHTAGRSAKATASAAR